MPGDLVPEHGYDSAADFAETFVTSMALDLGFTEINNKKLYLSKSTKRHRLKIICEVNTKEACQVILL